MNETEEPGARLPAPDPDRSDRGIERTQRGGTAGVNVVSVKAESGRELRR
jgi:hypothetical protein